MDFDKPYHLHPLKHPRHFGICPFGESLERQGCVKS